VTLQIPLGCQEIHHEIELGVVIGKRCKNVSESEVMDYVVGYVLALDMTARDFQNEAKKKGNPWTMAKCFDTSCPIGEFIPKSSLADPHKVNIVCSVNGEKRQDGNTADMVIKGRRWR
jgi:acylpyruvate hydrolase